MGGLCDHSRLQRKKPKQVLEPNRNLKMNRYFKSDCGKLATLGLSNLNKVTKKKKKKLSDVATPEK